MIKTIKENKFLYASWSLTLICISLSLITNNILALAAFAIIIASILFMQSSDAIALIIGIMPFANIFKFSADSTSLFTICEIALVAILIFKRKTIKSSVFITLALLSAYMIITSYLYGNINPLTKIKVLLGFLLIRYAIYFIKQNDVINIAYLFASSTAIMLLLSSNSTYSEYIMPYLEDLNYFIDSSGQSTDIMRNSGFFGDPNYCAMIIITALALLSILYYYKNIGVEFWVFISILVPLGFLTYSKSYFLTIVALVVMLVVFVLLPNHTGWGIISIVLIAVTISLTVSGKIEVLNMILSRFELNDLTTGRTELNTDYLNYIFSNPKTLFFGDGIVCDRFPGAKNNVHNIYIELFYKMGIVGCILYIATLFFAIYTPTIKNSNKKRKFVNYFPILFVVIMYFFLAGVTRYELPFYILISYIAFNYTSLANKQT